ncbi:hypothetical protein GCM10023205_13790 [Yinghuangia aomiensis]|uniref:Uncharacterized protein n=1 Tax=Yinghuangia aomiensis TaxID=676205 RepID=A0ABP9GUY3_9ACTN
MPRSRRRPAARPQAPLPPCPAWVDPAAQGAPQPESRAVQLKVVGSPLDRGLELRMIRTAVAAGNQVLDISQCSKPQLAVPPGLAAPWPIRTTTLRHPPSSAPP